MSKQVMLFIYRHHLMIDVTGVACTTRNVCGMTARASAHCKYIGCDAAGRLRCMTDHSRESNTYKLCLWLASSVKATQVDEFATATLTRQQAVDEFATMKVTTLR